MPRRRKPKSVAPVIGNPHSNEFHVIAFATGSCQWDKIAAPLEFAGVDDAIKAGLKACGHCAHKLDLGERTDAIEEEPAIAPETISEQ